MARIEIDLTVAEAEEIMTGLTWRLKQKGISQANKDEIKNLGERFGKIAEAALGADPGWWQRHSNKDVQITVKAPRVVYREL